MSTRQELKAKGAVNVPQRRIDSSVWTTTKPSEMFQYEIYMTNDSLWITDLKNTISCGFVGEEGRRTWPGGRTSH